MRYLPLTLVVLAATGCGGSTAGWSALPKPPFVRALGESVWAGGDLLYWGGESGYESTLHADGALYDPDARVWRRISRSPGASLGSAAAVWTGREVLVVGLGAAAFDPTKRTWRALPDPPLRTRRPVAVWTGKELIVWGESSRSSPAGREGAAFDPARNRWRRIADAPIKLNLANAVWTGKEMIVYGSLLDRNNRSRLRYARGIAYDPGRDRWRKLAPYRLSSQASTIAWTRRELVVWDYTLKAAAYDPETDRWRPLPKLPLHAGECYPDSVALEEAVFAWYCGQAAIFDVRRDAWRTVHGEPSSVYGKPVAAGDSVYFAGASHSGAGNALWEYRL